MKTKSPMYGVKVEKAIKYDERVDTYYVQFNFKKEASVKGFPTLEQAREYRDTVYKEKLKFKIEKEVARIRKAELKELEGFVPYPYNIFGEDEVSSDVVDHFDEILDRLHEREAKAIKLFYEEDYTLEQIGKVYGVTRERIRQIIGKGVRKIKYHVRYFKEELEKKQFKADLEEARSKLIQACRETGILPENASYYFGELTINHGKIMQDKPIEELGLDVRPYNALKKTGISTLSELIELEKDYDLVKIRNLGHKSCQEIIDKVHELGLKFADEE